MKNVGPRLWDGLVLASNLGAGTKVVGLALSRYANFESGRDVRPGFPRLAADCSLSMRTVERAVGELINAGWLVRISAGSGGPNGGRAALYQLKLPTGVSGVADPQPPTEMSVVEGRPPTEMSETPDRSVGDPRLRCRPNHQDLAESSTTTAAYVPTDQLAVVVEETLPPEFRQHIGSVDLLPGLAELHNAGWTPDDLRAALPPGTWVGARGVGVVVKRLRWLAEKQPERRTSTRARAGPLPKCATCGAASGAPRSERQIYSDDGSTSLGPCPACRPNDARRTA